MLPRVYLLALLAAALAACLAAPTRAQQNDAPAAANRTAADEIPIPCEAIDSVGAATMAADGTIMLRVHSVWPQPIVERELRYAPGDPHYEAIRRHVGGLAPGESKPLPPWCGTNSEP
jgi:hypothetical protein